MVRAFAPRLLPWYDRNRRSLPWRETSDPWAIWVSEIMLQQTRVEVVRRLFPQFMARYPRPGDFAAVDDDELLKSWQGLGYYRRARLLRAGAQSVQERHAGVVPSDPDDLGELPGIGTYTRGALASIAFGHCEPAVDGNVERVLARHRRITAKVKSSAGSRSLREAAAAVLDPDRPGDCNQALMELGATVCTPTSPRCGQCPVSDDCLALREDLTDRLPVLPKRRSAIAVMAQAVLVPRPRGKILGYRVAASEINGGQVDLPGPGPLVSHAAGVDLESTLRERFGERIALEAQVGEVRHGITHHRIKMTVHWAAFRGQPRPPLLDAHPADPHIPWTTIARKAFALAGLHSETDGG